MSSEWNADVLRVPGVLNGVVDGILSEMLPRDTLASLARAPLYRRRFGVRGQNGRAVCTLVLALSSSETPVSPRLSVLTKGISVCG